MSQQKFFDFSKIIGEEMEVLLTRLKSLIGAKKITDNLPDNLQGEIDEINEKIEAVNKIKDALISGFDGGTYEQVHTHTYGDWEYVDEIYHQKSCECGDVVTEAHKWDEGVVTVEPTTTSTGVMTYTCNACGESKTEEIPKIITLETLDIGSKVYLNVDGVPKKFIVVHQGLPSADYDSSCDGTWLLMEDIYEKRSWDRSGVSSFIASDVSAYLNNIFLYNLDNEIQRVIKHVIIPDSVSGQIATTIFLLSGYEVGWTISNFMELAKDGSCLDYFADMLVSDNGRVAYDNGVAYDWWLRSRDRMSKSFALCVDGAGVGQTFNQTTVQGIRPALILPRDLAVSEEDGIYNIIV